MPKDHFLSAAVSPEVAERFQEFIDRYNLTKSQGVRMFVENGLEVVERDGLDPVVQHEYQLTGSTPHEIEDPDDEQEREIEA